MLVSGLGANVEMWTPFRRSLGARHTIAFDAPGTGESSTPLRPLCMRELGAVTLGLLDALGYDEVDVLGYSFGGAIAQEMARAAPGRIHRLVLAATSCGWGSVPGDPFAMLAMLTPSRYYFGPVTAAVNALFGARTHQRLRDRRCGASAPSARPDRLLVAAARRARMVVIAVAPPCAACPLWCSPRGATAWCARARPGCWLTGSPTRASRSYPARTTSSCSREDTRAASQLVTSFLDEQSEDQPDAELACT